jgi:16S rRNA (cytosine1402-N4)-methyltransferase
MTFPHIPVLKKECLSVFDAIPLKYFVDCTIGAGGHSEAILETHPELHTLIGLDQDSLALKIAEERLAKWKNKLILKKDNFANLGVLLKESSIFQTDGILLDLGVSSMQLDIPEKGFSFMKEGPLDMRMDTEADLTAYDIVNFWPEEELGRIFREYGEEKKWRFAAKAIIKARKQHPIQTTLQLAEILQPILFKKKKKGINPLTLIFQAIRIAVNRELDVLKEILPQAIQCLRPGGRLAVISFHSLEDRIVKNVFSFYASDKFNTEGIGGIFLDKKPEVLILTKKPLMASEAECTLNPRSRSAKLRVVEKL